MALAGDWGFLDADKQAQIELRRLRAGARMADPPPRRHHLRRLAHPDLVPGGAPLVAALPLRRLARRLARLVAARNSAWPPDAVAALRGKSLAELRPERRAEGGSGA